MPKIRRENRRKGQQRCYRHLARQRDKTQAAPQPEQAGPAELPAGEILHVQIRGVYVRNVPIAAEAKQQLILSEGGYRRKGRSGDYSRRGRGLISVASDAEFAEERRLSMD